MRRILVAVLGVCQAASVLGQPPPARPGPDVRRPGLRENVEKLITSIRQFGDWDAHHAMLVDAMERVYDRNGWNTESDRFSLDMMRQVEAIPPWSPQERLDRMMEIIGDRYLLDERQEQVLRNAFIRESNEIFAKHSGRIMEYALDAIQTRASGQAFTADQIARWVQIGDPVFQETRERMARASQEFLSELDPAQRELAQADLNALNRRMADVERMKERWARGEWQPDDWGLEEDPIQVAGQVSSAPHQPAQAVADEGAPVGRAEGGGSNAGEAPAVPNTPQPADPPPASPVEPGGGGAGVARHEPPVSVVPSPGSEDNDPWAQYVRTFIQRYRLDPAQQGRAWRIYRDVKARGDRVRKTFGDQIEAARKRVQMSGNETADAQMRDLTERQKAELDKLFAQIKQRLERLPTRAQRRAAEAAAPPARPAAASQHDTSGP